MARGDSSFFDAPEDLGYEGKQNGNPYPTVPTLDTAYGTPTGEPAPQFASGSPYFDAAPAVNPQQYSTSAPTLSGMAPTAPTMTGGGFDWSQFIPAESSFSASQTVNSAPTSSGYNAPGFVAPTGVDAMNDPGAQYRIDQARKGVEASALGRGTLLTGGTGKAISQTIQDQASAEYQNVFNRALAGYSENANVGLANAGLANQAAGIANQNSQFNAGLAETHNQNQYNNSYNLANLGLNAAQLANQEAGLYGTNLTNLATGYGGNLAGLYGTQGNINASAAAGQGNIWSGLPGTLAGVGQAYLAGQTPKYGYGNVYIPPGSITSLGQTGHT